MDGLTLLRHTDLQDQINNPDTQNQSGREQVRLKILGLIYNSDMTDSSHLYSFKL